MQGGYRISRIQLASGSNPGAISTRRGHVQLGHALFLPFENLNALSSIEGLKVSDRAREARRNNLELSLLF
jgi:hypothetical protein